MKKRLFTILILCFALLTSLVSFGGCNNADDGNGGGGHVHAFTQQVDEDKYFKEDATCEHGKLYFYSCECGEMGTQTFESGRALEHVYDQMVESDKYLESEGDCSTAPTYYYSCKCGAKGEDVFDSQDGYQHNFEDGVCTDCGQPEDEE